MGKKLSLALLMLFFSLIVPSHLLAQQISVKGRVLEKETGQPLPGVAIVI